MASNMMIADCTHDAIKETDLYPILCGDLVAFQKVTRGTFFDLSKYSLAKIAPKKDKGPPDFDMFESDENSSGSEEEEEEEEDHGSIALPKTSLWYPLISDECNSTSTLFLRHIFPAIGTYFKNQNPKNFQMMIKRAQDSKLAEATDLLGSSLFKHGRAFWLYIMTLDIIVDPESRGTGNMLHRAKLLDKEFLQWE
jgi:hypothetical protein